MPSYADAVHVHDDRWEVPAGWHQGRGAWGGLVTAAVIRAATTADASEPGTRLLREVSVHMVGPLPAGPARLTTTLVRRGSATAIWQVEIAGTETYAVGTVTLGADRASDFAPHTELHRPDVADWTAIDPLTLGPPLAPEFLQHLAVRPVGGFPYSGGHDDVLSWVAPGTQIPAYDDALLVGMVDALWPAALVQVTEPRPLATLAFTATLLVDPATVDPALPLLHRGRLLAYAGGYATESRELWTADGRLAVHNTQVITVIR